MTLLTCFLLSWKKFKNQFSSIKKNHHKNSTPPKKKPEIKEKNPNQNTPPQKKTPHVKFAVHTCIASGSIHVHISNSQFVVKKKINHTGVRTEVLIHVMTIIIIRVENKSKSCIGSTKPDHIA